MESHYWPSLECETHANAAPKTWGKSLEAILKNTESKVPVNPFNGKSAEFVA